MPVPLSKAERAYIEPQPEWAPDIGLEDLLKRCHEMVEGECLEWAQTMCRTTPHWNLKCEDGKWRPHSVRNVIWRKTRGPVPKGKYVVACCGNDACVHPDHLGLRTMSKITSKPKKPAHALAIAIAVRKRLATKVTPALVREIRASTEDGYALDRRHGLSLGYSSRIRHRRNWRSVPDAFTLLFDR